MDTRTARKTSTPGKHVRLALALGLVVATSLARADEPALQIRLTPLPAADGRTIGTLEIEETLSGPEVPAGEAVLELAHVRFNVPSAATRVELQGARDEDGPLDLAAQDLGEADAAVRQWLAGRSTRGAVTVTYRIPITSELAPRGAAPPTELRNDSGAVSGAGSSFILRPPAGEYLLSIDWDLGRLPAGAAGVSSLGYAPAESLAPDTLDSVYFMAGDIGQYPEPADQSRFFSAWQGEPPFDAPALMAKAAGLQEQFIAFFDAPRSGYGIMMRPNPVNAGGGIGLHRSFVITFDGDTDVEELAFTLSHEMFHTYQPHMDAGGGPNSSLANAWFNEGLAVFYQREFLFRSGQIDSAAYLRDLNVHAARYYTSALGNTPNAEIADGFWRDTRIRTLPYDRGFLYFATVDESVRAASEGRRSLDDLVKAMRRKQDSGQVLSPADWVAVLNEELGADGATAFIEMLAGATPLPSSGAFGPCFERVEVLLRRYDLGFEPAVLVEPERIVRGLSPESAAAGAGLRDGDRIVKPVPQDAIQGDQDGLLTLLVARDGEEFPVTYLPRGETVPAWQWRRIAEVPESACRRDR